MCVSSMNWGKEKGVRNHFLGRALAGWCISSRAPPLGSKGSWHLFSFSVSAHAAQRELQKLTVGYTPISGAALPFFIAVEENLFQKHGFEISPVFMGGSPLINAAILAGEFPIGYTGGGAILSSRLSGSDLIVIGSPLPILTLDAWARGREKGVRNHFLRLAAISDWLVYQFGGPLHL